MRILGFAKIRKFTKLVCLRNLTALLFVMLPSCRAKDAHTYEPATLPDRLVAAYPALKSGRFAIIADFESPDQMEIVSLEASSSAAVVTWSPHLGRPATGGSAAVMTLAGAGDVVELGNRAAQQWYMQHDWRPYDLLGLSLYVPLEGSLPPDGILGLLEIESGHAGQTRAVRTTFRVRSGWNELLFDLAEVRDRVPMDDIQCIRFSFQGLLEPTTFRLDDVFLTSDWEMLLADSSAAEGTLYVERVGKRLRVGSAGWFELTFANGQIVAWRDLAADPHGVRNLVEGTVLGPSPFPAEAANLSSRQAFRVTQRLLECTPIRAVIRSHWQRGSDRTPTPHEPALSWTYSVYPTGNIYVQAAAHNMDEPLRHTFSRWAVTVSGTAESPADYRGDRSESNTASGGESDVLHAMLRPEGTNAAVLVALHRPPEDARISVQTNERAGRTSAVVEVGSPARCPSEWNVQLVLCRAEALAGPKGRSRALSYAQPPPVTVALTNADTQGPAAPTPVAVFDPADGCYVTRAASTSLSMVLDGSDQALLAPAFRISADPGNEAWVYVNDKLWSVTGRTRDDEIIFQLPGEWNEDLRIDVLFARPRGGGGR